MHYSLLDGEKMQYKYWHYYFKKKKKKEEEFENITEIKRIQKHITQLLNIKLQLKRKFKIYKEMIILSNQIFMKIVI